AQGSGRPIQLVVVVKGTERPGQQAVVERPTHRVAAVQGTERARHRAAVVVPNRLEHRADSTLLAHSPVVPGAANPMPERLYRLLLPCSFRYCGEERELSPG